MKKLKQSVVMVALSLLLTACGGGSSSSGSGSSTGASGINGTFAGEWRSDSSNNGELAGRFNASGTTLTATVTRHTVTACPLSSFKGSWSAASSTLNGTFSGGGGSAVTWNASLVGDRLSGRYKVTAGNCAGDAGTITLNRT